MAQARSGYIQQLPSGSFRVSVYAGTDPLTGRQIRLRRTCKTERAAQIELGKLLEEADAGHRPETDATVAQLMDRYTEVADWDLSTRKANEVYIRRVIKPALGHLQVRKIRGPLLDLLYTQLRRCSDPVCTGKRFIEHQNVPLFTVDPTSCRSAWQQIADTIREAISSGMLAAGDPLPSVREMSALQKVPVATLQHAMAVLAGENLLVVRQGRTAVVAGDAAPDRKSARATRSRDHDCKSAGCQPHVCKPMAAKTIRNIHSILSGAFATAKRWEWIAWNPAESARPPAASRRPLPATSPEDVAKVIAEGRKAHPEMALYLWLVAITGARRGELCALQVCDADLEKGILHIAFNYVVVDGRRVRKDTKTHQDRYLAVDPVTCAVIGEHLDGVRARLADVGVELHDDAYVFSNDPAGATPWNPDWASHKASDLAAAAGIKLNIKGLRHYTASQLLAARFDLRNTAARLGHGGGGATTLRHYADPVSEVDRRAAAYLAQLTAGSPTNALREARSLALHALAAPIPQKMTLTTLAALGLSKDPFHEPFHARGLYITWPCYCVASRNVRQAACTPCGHSQHEATSSDARAQAHSGRRMGGDGGCQPAAVRAASIPYGPPDTVDHGRTHAPSPVRSSTNRCPELLIRLRYELRAPRIWPRSCLNPTCRSRPRRLRAAGQSVGVRLLAATSAWAAECWTRRISGDSSPQMSRSTIVDSMPMMTARAWTS